MTRAISSFKRRFRWEDGRRATAPAFCFHLLLCLRVTLALSEPQRAPPLNDWLSPADNHCKRLIDWRVNLAWYFFNGLFTTLFLGPPALLIAWLIHSALPASVTGAAAGLPLWARMVAAMIVGEIGFYWGHRWSHESPFLWRFHAVHHSAEHVNFLVNTRGHPVDMIFTRLCGLTLLYATDLTSPVGPNPSLVPMLVLFIGSLWSFFIHANVRWRLGPLEEIIASPAFHHWHHTLEDHKDHNYSSMLPFIDRLFGTFYLPKAWPKDYGTSTPVPETMIGQLLEPLAPTGAARVPSPAPSSTRA
jgi:sterol desaturase/sphingolipid hydroxylase (fatty acid hydroxylase superfamily)